MRLARALGPALLVAIMMAPPWLDAAAQAPVPGLAVPALPSQADPLVRVLQDLQGFLGGTAPGLVDQVSDPGPGGVPVPVPDGGLRVVTNTTVPEAQADVGNLTSVPIRTLYYEGFEGSEGLAARGWTQEVVRGRAPWGVADAVNQTVTRMDGTTFTPEFETGESRFMVPKDGRKAAAIMNAQGRYDARVDARLISPVIDLRYVTGASQRTDDPYDFLTKDPEVGEPYRVFMQAWRNSIAPLNPGQAGVQPVGFYATWLLVTPPSQLQRLVLDSKVPGIPCEPEVFLAPCGPPGEVLFVNPLAQRYGAALVNLTFYHKYDLPVAQSPTTDAFLDGVFLEARVVGEDGTAGPWEHLLGDAVFEPNVNRNQSVFLAFPDPGGFPPVDFFGVPVSTVQVPVSGSVENTQGVLAGESEYAFPMSWYWGRVELRPYAECFGLQTQRADCQPDAPAFVIGSFGRVKSHFTLNRFAGERIQLAWRVHSGVGSTTPADLGWSVDAIKVEALLPLRDPGVEAVAKPRPGDLVPTTVLLQPEARIKNFGAQRVEDLRVNFTILEDLPGLTPEELQAALLADAGQLTGTSPPPPGQLPGPPPAPGQTSGAVLGAALRQPRVFLRGSASIPALESLEARLVQAPEACLACAPGRYRLVVEVAAAPLSGGTPGSPPTDRVEDGAPENNRLEVPFQVRDVPEAVVRLSVAPASVLSDINEPKTLRLDLENRGNMDLTGTVQVSAQRLDPETLAPVPGESRLPAGALVVNAGDLPAGTRLTSYGGARNRLQGNVTWTPANLPPGVYRLEAQFESQPRAAGKTTDAVNAFIRATPTAYFPGDGRAREDFEVVRNTSDFFDEALPQHAGLSHVGYRACENPPVGCSSDPPDGRRLPQGPVSLNHTWNATAADGPIAELTVLSLLAGNPGIVATVPGFTAFNATLRVGPAQVRYPNVTFDPDRGEVVVPPIEVQLPRIQVLDRDNSNATVVALDLHALGVPGSTAPVPLAAPNATAATPPVDTRTEPRVVTAGPATAEVPAVEVRVGQVVARVVGQGPDARLAAVEFPAVTVDVPPIRVSVAGAVAGETPPQRLVIPAPAPVTSPDAAPHTVPGQAPSSAPQEVPVNRPLPLSRPAGTYAVGAVLDDRGLTLCVRQPTDGAVCNASLAQRFNYTYLDDTLSSPSQVRTHTYLNDYYLTREVDLRRCTGGCQPVVSFWHLGRFQWNASTPDQLTLPGAQGAPLDMPSSVRSVDPEQSGENQSRGLVEAVILSDPGVRLRQDVLPEHLGTGVLPNDARPTDLCLATSTAGACPLVDTLPEAGCVPPSTLPVEQPALLPVPIGQPFAQLASARTCAREVLGGPVDDAYILREFRRPLREWERVEVALPAAFRGERVQLTFHFQTTVGQLQENVSNPSCLGVPNPPVPVRCFYLTENWALDNIRVYDRAAAGGGSIGFSDSVGDRPGDQEWRNWKRFRTLRETLDHNVVLGPACFLGLNRPVGDGALADPARDAAALANCLGNARTGFQGVVVGVDGRGWDVWTAGADLRQPNGFENPFYDGWFIDGAAGFQAPGAEDPTRTRALRFGGPGGGGTYPGYDSYSIVSTGLLALDKAARPFAEMVLNHSISRADISASGRSPDGAAVFLARYAAECVPGAASCPLVFDARTTLHPETGYPGAAEPRMARAVGVAWETPTTPGAAAHNSFVGRSGVHPRHSTYIPLRFDLEAGLAGLCLKAVTRDGITTVENHTRGQCAALGRDVVWQGGQGVHKTTGVEYRNITRFEEDPGGRYALEFHAANTGAQVDAGLAIDDLRVAEQYLANDLGVSRQVFPPPGGVIGPGESVQVRINVTNHGLFTQRGVRLHFNVTQQGNQVFPDPENLTRNPAGCGARSCSQLTPGGTPIPGLRDANPQKNVSFAFETPWVPPSEGSFTINTWVEIVGEVVAGRLVPLQDENALNDLRTERLQVSKVRSVRLLPPEEQADEAVVVPLVGTTEDRRTLRVVVENLGTVSEGQGVHDLDAAGQRVPRDLRVRVDIADEAGRPVPGPQARVIDLLAAGKTIAAEFVWQPPSGGLYTLAFTAESAQDLVKADNRRVVRVLVLTQLLPTPGQPWPTRFLPEGDGWHNASRFDPAAAWSFGSGDTHGPLEQGSLALDQPVDLTNFRNAVLTLKHRYDLELGYDGGVVEVSADGRDWEPVAPLVTTDAEGRVLYRGYPGALTTASAEVPRPGDEVRAFTGDSGGVVTSVIPLGTAPVTRSEPVVLLRDTFDPGPALMGADLAVARGQWAEVRGRSEPPAGKAWWVGKDLVWRSGQRICWNAQDSLCNHVDLELELAGSNGQSGQATLEGTKTLFARADGTLVVPRLDAPLVVEYDEWRGLGLSKRGTNNCQAGYCRSPNAVEVALERLNATTLVPDFSVVALPPAADTVLPYGDNHLEWTRRSIILPAQQVKQFFDAPARLAFRIHLANSNNEVADPRLPSAMANGTGRLEDTDFLSPHLGWAIAAPKLYYITNRDRCAALANTTFDNGRCLLFQDDLSRYPDGDAAAGAADSPWSGHWETEKFNRSAPARALSSGVLPDDGALVEGGWKLVQAVRLLTDKPVWDTRAQAAARTGRGAVAEATGSGVDARLVTPLNLRSAAGEVTLRLDHSFKFTDLTFVEQNPPMTIRGGVSGGRVEVSRDGGQSWEPLAPKVPLQLLPDGTVDRQAYTKTLEQAGFLRTFSRGTPTQAQQCARPTHAGCLDPADPFPAPGGWQADDEPHGWSPFPAHSAHTPFGPALTDPERNSPFGVGGLAFGGTTCRDLRAGQDPCDGAEDWRAAAFDLTPYAGQEVLLGFHAFFTTHRHAAAEHPCLDAYSNDDACTATGAVVMPRDFWRIDDVAVESRVLDGKPLHLRLRGFSDADGERYGWDIHNVTLLGDRHLRNLGVRILSPAEGTPLFAAQEPVTARVVNRGQQPLRAVGAVVVEQAGTPALLDPGFEAGLGNWTLEATGGTAATTPDAAEGRQAVRLSTGSGQSVALSQRLRIPAGHWRLVGLADVGGAGPGTPGVRVLGATAADGRADPLLALPPDPGLGAYRGFGLPFTVEGRDALVTVQLLVSPALLGAFSGAVLFDHLRLEPRPPPQDEPPAPALANPSFEQGLDGWTLGAGQGRLQATTSARTNQWQVTFPTRGVDLGTQLATAAGSQNATLAFAVPDLNVTWFNFTVTVTSPYRLQNEILRVEVAGPNGQAGSASLQMTPRVEVPAGLPPQAAALSAVPPGPAPVLPVNVQVQAAPAERAVNASSVEEALADPGIPGASRNGTGTWTIRINVTPETAALAPLHEQEQATFTVKARADTYAAAARAVTTAGGLANVFEGQRAAVLTALGHGPRDAELTQDLALVPGKYRLEGLFASRPAKAALVPAEAGDAAAAEATGTGIRQTLAAADLPRRITGLELLTDATAAADNQFDVFLEDAQGNILESEAGLDVDANGVARTNDGTTPFSAPVPAGAGTLHLRVVRTAGSAKLLMKQDDAYPRGSAARVDNPGAALGDLRVTFLGAVEADQARSVAVLAGGAGGANRTSALAPGQGSFDLGLNASIEHQVRQVVALGDLAARRITNATLQVRWPEIPAVPGPPDPSNGTARYYAVRQVALRAQLFDLAGQPLSEEAAVPDYARSTLQFLAPAARVPAAVATVQFNFTNAFLPPGTTHLVVGLRAVNASAAAPVLLRTSRDPAEDPLADGWLQVSGARGFPAGSCAAPEAGGEARCDLPLELAYRREARVAVDVAGAQGEPALLTQRTAAPASFDAQNGGVPFRVDFTVPPGRAAVQVRFRADAWQGDAILDGLRVVALTQPAATFSAEVPPGGEAPVLTSAGAAPRISTLRGAAYVVTAEAAIVDGAGNVVGELVLGDNRATRRTGAALGPGRLVVDRVVGDPNSINLTTGQAANVRLVVRNEGATEAELLRASGTITTKAGVRVAEFSQADFDPIPEDLVFAPLEERTLLWPYQPDPTLAHAVYVLSATIATQPLGEEAPFESANSSLLYLGTDFHRQFAFEWPFGNATTEDALDEMVLDPEAPRNSDRWTSDGEHNMKYPALNECDPPPPGQNQDQSPCVETDPDSLGWNWVKTAQRNLSAFRSITMPSRPDYSFPRCCQGQDNAAGTLFTVVRSAGIEITDMQRPQMLYADRHEFNGVEPEGTIFARLLDRRSPDKTEWKAFPPGPCLERNNFKGWVQVDSHITGATPGFRSDKWVLRNVDLGPLMDRALAETGRLEPWTHVQLCWHLEQPSPRSGANLVTEWSIDDVLVTPYGMALAPGQRIPITDNVTKDFRLVVRNRGAYTDTYRLSLEEETGLPVRGPSNWQVSVRDALGRPLDEIRVPPGEERAVLVRVKVDVAPPTMAREGTVDLALTAISKTTSFLRSTQHLLFDFTYEDRPNLRIAGLIVNDATLSVDKPRTVDVLVQNTGPVTARNVKVSVVDKMDPAFGVAPEELRLLDGSPVAPIALAPGDTKVVTVNWIPRVAGEHNLTAVADPEGRILEFNERDNVLVKPIVVPKAEFPDLLVEASASTANPGPGDLVEVRMRITNKGGAPATGIQVSVRAGVTDLLPGEPPHILAIALAPGASHELVAQWRPAFPGEQTIILRAKTAAGILERLDTSGDNVVLLVIKVRSRGLDLVLPPDLTVAPGTVVNATVEVHNRGDVDDTYVVRVEPPGDWRGVFAGAGEEVRVTVGNHSHRNLTLQLGPPRHAEAGPAAVRLRAQSENGTEAVEAHLVASVPQDFGLRFTLAPEHVLPPGRQLLPLALRNDGNGLERVTVRARTVPAGWAVEPTTFHVAPRSTAEVRVNLTSPTTTPEGVYELVLEAQGRGGDLLAQRARVLILPRELLALEVQGVPAVLVPGSAHEGSLVLRNAGNVPARADLAVEGPAGWRVRLERDAVSVNPGEARSLDLGLVVPANASALPQALTARAVSGTQARYALREVLRPALADLEVASLEVLPRGPPRDGAALTIVATVVNRGEVALPVHVAAYVNDALLGSEEGPLLAPGAEARVNLTFRARGGEHVLLVAVDPAGTIGEEDETNNARLAVLRVDRAAGLFAVPGPGAEALLLAAAAVALALRRRPPGDRAGPGASARGAGPDGGGTVDR